MNSKYILIILKCDQVVLTIDLLSLRLTVTRGLARGFRMGQISPGADVEGHKNEY